LRGRYDDGGIGGAIDVVTEEHADIPESFTAQLIGALADELATVCKPEHTPSAAREMLLRELDAHPRLAAAGRGDDENRSATIAV
jgi:hypothetical protein